MKKYNVLILVDKFDYHGSCLNGPQRNYTWLLQHIDKKKINISIYTLKKKGPSSEIFKRGGIKLGSLGVDNYNPFSVLISIVKICSIITKKRIDLLHLQGYASEVIGGIAGAIKGRPVIVKEEWVDPNLKGMIRFIERQTNRFAARFIAISHYVKQYLMNKKGISENKIALIPNGLPIQQFRQFNEKMRKAGRNRLGIEENDIVLGIVGMLHENKGHKYFIEAAYNLLHEGVNAHFLIIGDGELRGYLENQVNSLEINKCLHFLGEQDKIQKFLPLIDIFISASDTESFGTSILEAMASGRAIITTESGGGNELIHNGFSGIVVPIRNSFKIANAAKYLIDHPEKREYFGINAMTESNRYDIFKTIKDTEELYVQTIFQHRKHEYRDHGLLKEYTA